MKTLFKNLQQVYINNKAVTIAEEWEETIDGLVFLSKISVQGHWKKASTFERKNLEQNVNFY